MGLVVVCTYRVRTGQEAAFERLLKLHAPTLRTLGLINDFPTSTLRRVDSTDPLYVEVFEWDRSDAAVRTSQVPDVIAIWEPMAALCESRDGLPGLEFPLFDQVTSGQKGTGQAEVDQVGPQT